MIKHWTQHRRVWDLENKIDCLVDIRLYPNGQLSRFALKRICLSFDKLADLQICS